jgi:MFS family permease
MGVLQTVFMSRWRAVTVLGITQILAWGAIHYTPVLMAPLIAQARGWTLAFAMGGFSLCLLISGLVSPIVGGLIDRFGGHCVLPFGSLLGAAGLVGLALAEHPIVYLAVWALLGVASSASLYDSAFATLGRIFGTGARRAITLLTFAGGFASTVSWPATYFFNDAVGWQNTYFIYAALLALIAAPLHAFVVPRERAASTIAIADDSAVAPAVPVLPAHGWNFLLVVAAFAAFAFVNSGLLANLLAMFQRHGIEAATAVAIGALFGPCQVASRLCEFMFARNVHPLTMARFAALLLGIAFVLLGIFGLSFATAAAFMILLGLSNGLITIARGTVPLSLFGPVGYGRLIGRIAGPSLIVQASAPLAIAFVAERGSDPLAFGMCFIFVAVAIACFLGIRRPGNP